MKTLNILPITPTYYRWKHEFGLNMLMKKLAKSCYTVDVYVMSHSDLRGEEKLAFFSSFLEGTTLGQLSSWDKCFRSIIVA